MPASARKPHVLLVEDTLSLARTYMEYLRGEDIKLEHIETGRQALAVLTNNMPDVVLLDLMLPDMNGIEILKHIYEHQMPCGVIVVTAHGSLNVAVDAMRYGAADFIVKPFTADRLTITLRNTLERQRLTHIVETYQTNIDRQVFCGFIGSSLPMQAVYRTIESAATSRATVFITGESGTGKEVCAAAIHQQSPRNGKPFIALNCSAIPRDLIESEIFGHVRGAFTGAQTERDGAASLANGGTLFLDEICEMDIDLQTKLLRFIQTGTFRKVGGSSDISVDVRFICATNRDPQLEIAAGRFREDLFYRLHVVPIFLPPLSERGDDVLQIAESLLENICAEEKRSFTHFSDEVQAVFMDYNWPGNVRQLQNVIRNVVVLNDAVEVTRDMLPAPLDQIEPMNGLVNRPVVNGKKPTTLGKASHQSKPMGGIASEADIRPLAEAERDYIEQAIKACKGNIPKAAVMLDVSASTIYRKKVAWEKADENA